MSLPEEKRITRARANQAPTTSAEKTPDSGETTTGTTHTWSKGTSGNNDTGKNVRQDRPRIADPVPHPAVAGGPNRKANEPVPDGPKSIRDTGARSTRSRSARTLRNRDRESQLSVLMAELEVRKAELELAQKAAEEAKGRLEVARIMDTERSSIASDAGAQERASEWVESHIHQRTRLDTDTRNRANVINTDVTQRLPYTVMSHRPVPELPNFDGNILEWLAFRAEFEDSAPNFSNVNNVSRIRKALRGDARIAVKSIMYTVSDPYEILEALERHFGDPEEIILSEIRNVKKMPRLADDCSNIVMFASHVANTVATIRALRQDKYLYAPELVNKISDKLNLIIRYEWAKYKQVNTSMPDLVAMSTFLKEISVTAKQTHNRNAHSSRHRGATHTVGRDNVRSTPIHGGAMPRSAFAGPSAHSRDSSSDSNYTDSESYHPRPVSAVGNRQVVNITAPPRSAGTQRKARGSTQSAPHKPKIQTAVQTDKNNKGQCGICKGSHKAEVCAEFLKLSVSERWESVRRAKLCFRCLEGSHRRPIKCKYVACGVSQCEAGHHKLLHGLTSVSHPTKASVSNINHVTKANTYLKIVPVELSGPLGTICTHALLDEGSTMTLIERDTADLVAPREPGDTLTIEGVGGHEIQDRESCLVSLSIRGQCSRNLEKIKAYTINKLSLTPQEVSRDLIEQCRHLSEITDELCYERATPTILIGQDQWSLIVSRQILSGEANLPVASLTKLGWCLHGQYDSPRNRKAVVNHLRPKTTEDEILSAMKDHFSIESLGVESRIQKSDPDKRALDILEATCRKIPGENRYETSLLWREDNVSLPCNKAQALKRLYSLESKLDRDGNLMKEFSAQVDNLVSKGYAEAVNTPPAPDAPRNWYLPIFPTIHAQKGSMRLVFDAKATTQGCSLNQALLTGPDLLKSLFGVLIRFREGKIAVIADVKEMFLQVSIKEQDRDSLRFLWRGGDRSSPPQEYRMKRLIFGASCSPTIALYVKNKNASDNKNTYPVAAEMTMRNTYMDDMLIAMDASEDEARQTVNDIYELNMLASFELRKFASNAPSVISDVSPKAEPTSILGGSDVERTLGLRWNHRQDTLGFNVNLRNTPPDVLNASRLPTKRQVTSSAMSIFDPIGYASPVSVLCKSLMQEIWRSGIGWDDQIPERYRPAWVEFVQSLQKLKELEIPRHVPAADRRGDLHTFCDASEKVYAACVYFVGKDATGTLRSSLVAAKARVAPLKTISIPRLELQSCVLGTRLSKAVATESDYEIVNRYFWSDSRTALSWIKSDPRTFKSFVAHRLAEIEEDSSAKEWGWVPSSVNIADYATKCVPAEFSSEHLWFKGPEFITLGRDAWPKVKSSDTAPPPTGEERIKVASCRRTQSFDYLPNVDRFSRYSRLVRSTARVIVAAEAFKARLRHERPEIEMNNGHLKLAELLLIRRSQMKHFNEDIRLLKNDQPLPKKSPLHKIAVKLNRADIMVLDSRVDRGKMDIPILHAKEDFTRLLIQHFHEKFNHGNHATVINELKQRYYIIGMRGAIRYICSKCQWCRTYKGATLKAPVGDLPIERLQANSPPFTATAIDLYGPMTITIGRRHEKRWGVLFTCLTTRAVHLELAATLSASSTILALRRMMARRGTPTVIYSDHGTNFVGSEREIKQALATLPQHMQTHSATRDIVWKKIPPGNPAAGGAWERMVGCVKAALRVTLREKAPHEEVLHTLTLEAEHIINSRPLTPVNPDLNEEALTPNHFLLLRSNAMTPMGSFKDDHGLGSWKTAQALADRFWKRWIFEYRPLLYPRTQTYGKFKSPQVGDIVIVADNTMPRGTWPRGEIAQVYPGPDGHVRLTSVRTASGTFKRPTNRLIWLCSP